MFPPIDRAGVTLIRSPFMSSHDTVTDLSQQEIEQPEPETDLNDLFEEVDLFSTALIQGGCTDQPTY